MSVAWPFKLLIGMATLVIFLALLLPYLLATRTIGLPFQRAVMLFQPMLEDAYQPYTLQEGDAIAGLIVLGGNTTRIAAAEQLLAQHPKARSIFSGPRYNEVAMIERMQLSPDRIAIDYRASDTYENAYFTKALGAISPGEKWLLVTSALHMPRALGAFRALCLDVKPWPVRDALPQPQYSAPVVYREVAGFLVYLLSGRMSLNEPRPGCKTGL